ncbi:MAG: transcription elongation factor GreA [Pseudomonadota bacterium]
MVEKVPMTKDGYDALARELKRRQSEDRPKIIEAISEARAHDDLSENAEYHAAKEQQSLNEGRINEIEDKLARADVIDPAEMSGDTVKFSAKVTIVDEETDEVKTYQFVGDVEAVIKQNRISLSSPIARALINKKVGDSVEVAAPGGKRDFEILQIQYG